MGANAGPDIVSDGLVLALDAADNNSFRGEPTENIAAANLGFSNMTQGGISYSFVEVEDGWRKYSISGTGNSNTYPYTFNILLSTILVSTRTSFSFKYKTNVESKYVSFGAPRMVNIVYATGRSSTHTQENGYRTAKLENVSPASGTEVQSQRIYFLSRPIEGAVFNPSTDFLYFKDVQAERSPYATRFTTGTRGTTVATGGGWADISGNDNHGEILNGTSTSNDGSVLGALDFDGTNDYLSINTSNLNNLSEGSVEFWFKSSTTGPIFSFFTDMSNYFVIWTGDSTGFWSDESIRIIYRKNGTYFYNYAAREGNSYYADSNWHHCVFTVDSSGNKLYTDGSLLTVEQWSLSTEGNSSTRWLNDLSPSIIAFGRRVDNYTNVEVSLARIYNRALSASEVLQNYNSLKTRFGL